MRPSKGLIDEFNADDSYLIDEPGSDWVGPATDLRTLLSTAKACLSSVIPAIVIVSSHKVPATLIPPPYDPFQGEFKSTDSPFQQRLHHTSGARTECAATI